MIHNQMPKYSFTTALDLSIQIDAYFSYIEGEFHLQDDQLASAGKKATASFKVWDREPEPSTIAGLALFLGFNSRDAFDEYEKTGRFRKLLKRSRLRIEAIYEKKLHHQSSAGAIFALKSMGWNEKLESKPDYTGIDSIKIEIIETGPRLAESEMDVIL